MRSLIFFLAAFAANVFAQPKVIQYPNLSSFRTALNSPAQSDDSPSNAPLTNSRGISLGGSNQAVQSNRGSDDDEAPSSSVTIVKTSPDVQSQPSPGSIRFPNPNLSPDLSSLTGTGFGGLGGFTATSQQPSIPSLAGLSGLSGASQSSLQSLAGLSALSGGSQPSLQSLAGLSGLTGGSGLPGGLSGLSGLDPNTLAALSQSGAFGGANFPGGQPLPNFGQFPAALPTGQAAGNPAANGLLKVLGNLGSQLGRSLGINNLLSQTGVGVPQLTQLTQLSSQPAFPSASGGPPVPGLPAIPGLFNPAAALSGGGRNLDVSRLVSAVSRRVLNGSSVADVLPPDRLQSFADNFTDVLVPTLPQVDLSKFMGRWFEGVSSPKATDHRCVVHHYGGLTENGDTATYTALKIYRQGSEFGQVQYSIGYAFRGGRKSAMLQMHSSESQEASPYWIYHLGPIGKDSFGNQQYEYAIISNWIKYPVIVLVRDPDKFQKNYYVDVLRWMEDHGFISDFTRAFNLVQPTDYSNCQYSDSTFAAFG